MPTAGTPRSSYRLGPETLADLATIRRIYGLSSQAEAIRVAARWLAYQLGSEPIAARWLAYQLGSEPTKTATSQPPGPRSRRSPR